MKLKKIDLIFLILTAVLLYISIILLLNKSYQEAIENISKYKPFQNLYSGLLITFWVCLIGNLLPFPTPYTWVVCYSSQPFFTNKFIPFIIALVASVGCLAGEIVGYIIGRSASEVISEESTEKLKRVQKFIINHPKVAPILIFIFGLTPLSDDILIVPLGLIRYSVWKTVLFCWLGKFGLMLIFAYNLLNICNFIGGESWLLSIISLFVIVGFVYLFLRIDFFTLREKLRNKKG